MEIKELGSKQELNDFVGSQSRAQFLQSWDWGEFQQKSGHQIKRLGLYDGSQLVGSSLMILNKFNYWYVPRGPVISDQLHPDQFQEILNFFIEQIIKSAKKDNSVFIKLEPPLERHLLDKFEDVIKDYQFSQEKFVQPQDSWYLDLTVGEEELLKNMHQKTRYNIRLAEKKEVKIRVGETQEDFEIFWSLCEDTSSRDNFKSHAKQYYQEIFKILVPSGFTKLYLAEFEGKALAANLVYNFGDTSTYVHGASANEYRNLMAPHLLQWRQIQDAKADGYKYYDFWGVAPDDSKEHRWAGITRFKKGFGGQGVNYLGVYDLILKGFWYKIYKLAKKLR